MSLPTWLTSSFPLGTVFCTPVMCFSGFQVVCLETHMLRSLGRVGLIAVLCVSSAACTGTPVPRNEFVEGLQDTQSSAGLVRSRKCFPLGWLVRLKWAVYETLGVGLVSAK